MWEHQHGALRGKNWHSNENVPFWGELVVEADVDVILRVFIDSLVWSEETIESQKDQDGGVQVGDEEDVPSNGCVILGSVLSSLGLTNLLEDNCEDNIGEGNPDGESSSLVLILGQGLVPGLAVLLTVLKDHVKAWETVCIKNLIAVAVHLSKLILSWLHKVWKCSINSNPISSWALTLLKLFQVFGDSLEVIMSSITDDKANNHDHSSYDSILHLLTLADSNIFPDYNLWINNVLDFHISLLD